jgi:hypothetical protein
MLVLLAGALVLWLVNNAVRPQEPPALLLVVPGFATVGAVIMMRHRGHVVGWLLLGSAPLSLWVTDLKPVASELQPWSWPPRRPDLRLVHTCRDRSRPARTGGSRCRADPARTSTTARRRLRSHLVDSH